MYRSPLAGPSAPASSSCPPVVAESAQISSDSQPQTKRKAKLTRKDLRMHKSVLVEDMLPDGTALSYMSIYTSNGVSLYQLSLELSKNRKSSTKEHDDLFSICEDGGDLLCCQNCPRGFHTECVGLSATPQGIWHHDFCKSRFTTRTIIICDQCEKEYHVGCLKEQNIVDLKVRTATCIDSSPSRIRPLRGFNIEPL
ncbi:UNVERIFIED_CONTAM: Increased DNA methylation 1 [Sesamum radiatum]|uniref:Increased DNA methylation 1 n=1 Tax=Sesamum radiatum TaxID=300843 RepID=A0AAW2RE43_SESRA